MHDKIEKYKIIFAELFPNQTLKFQTSQPDKTLLICENELTSTIKNLDNRKVNDFGQIPNKIVKLLSK